MLIILKTIILNAFSIVFGLLIILWKNVKGWTTDFMFKIMWGVTAMHIFMVATTFCYTFYLGA